MTPVLKGFKDFLLRGNVVELATAVVIGTAFTGIVTAFTEAIINPLLAMAFDADALSDATVGPFRIGLLLAAMINFLIIAFVVFLLVKGVNRIKDAALRKQVAESSAAGPSTEALLAEIRDLLAARPER